MGSLRLRRAAATAVCFAMVGCGEGYRGVEKTITFSGNAEKVAWVACQDGIGDDWQVLTADKVEDNIATFSFQIHSPDERYGLAYVTKDKYKEQDIEKDKYTLHIRYATGREITEFRHLDFVHNKNVVEINGKISFDEQHTEASVYTSSGIGRVKNVEGDVTYDADIRPGLTDIAGVERKGTQPHRFFLQRNVNITQSTQVDIDFKNQGVNMNGYKLDFDLSEKNPETDIRLRLKGGTAVSVFAKNEKMFFLPESGLIDGDFLQVTTYSSDKNPINDKITNRKSMVEYYAASKVRDITHRHGALNSLSSVRASTNGASYSSYLISGLTYKPSASSPPFVGYEFHIHQADLPNFGVHLLVSQDWIKNADTVPPVNYLLVANYDVNWGFTGTAPITVLATAIMADNKKALDVFGYLQKDLVDGAKIYKTSQTIEMRTPANTQF